MKINFKHIVNSERGSSLLAVLLASAILVVVATTLASLVVQMRLQQNHISQKLEISELKNNLMQIFSDANKCTWQLSEMRIDTTANLATTVYPLPAVYAGVNATSALVARAETLLPNSITGLRVSTIQLKNLVSTGNPNEFTALVQTAFQTGGARFSLSPVQNMLTIRTNPNDPPNRARVSYCAIGGAPTSLSLQQVCVSMGGQFNSASQLCQLNPATVTVAGNNNGHGNGNDGTSNCSSQGALSSDGQCLHH